MLGGVRNQRGRYRCEGWGGGRRGSRGGVNIEFHIVRIEKTLRLVGLRLLLEMSLLLLKLLLLQELQLLVGLLVMMVLLELLLPRKLSRVLKLGIGGRSGLGVKLVG